MSKVRLIAQYHFRQEVTKRTFLLVLFSLPLFLTVTIGVGYMAARLERGSSTLGFVDPAGLLINSASGPGGEDVRLVSFETREAAQMALEEEQIDAYYVLAADYADTHRAELVYFEPPPDYATGYFQTVVRLNLLTGQSSGVRERLLAGPDVTIRATESNRDIPLRGPSARQFAPLMAAALFAVLVMTTTGYLMEVIVTEKENRTMEVVISSVAPTRMMAGKIGGALGIVLLQLVVWLVFLTGAVWLAGNVLDVGWFQNIELDWPELLRIAAVAVAAYLFIGALAAMVGSTLVESQEAQQAGMFLFFIVFSPIYLVIPILQSPNGPLALGLSLFPMTSVVAVAIRSLFIRVPVWQIAASVAVALASGTALVWLAGKAFRMSMLHYGKRLAWRELFARRSQAEVAPPDAGLGSQWRSR
jgi:ABC-2 type transport system permease protein